MKTRRTSVNWRGGEINKMSVIHVRKRTTKTEEDFSKFQKSDNSLILTDAKNIEPFTIELTLGEFWCENVNKDKPEMFPIKGSEITISPHKSIVIQVKEELYVPNNMFGLVMPTGGVLLECGIMISTTKIDPQFTGHLMLLIYNTSRVKRSLKKGTIVASAIFYRTESTLLIHRPVKQIEIIPKTPNILTKIVNYLKSPRVFQIVIIIIYLGILIVGILNLRD